ncbi:MAG TPA: efflux RND transporter periplasmic adaptor subunit [Candidatus Saccharimonadales bacterium]|nr:efflux RND transporter periplasmic adaptor subunit [Candidatus Saccharimonadales bacterium]
MNAKYRVFAMLGIVFVLSLGFYFYSTRGSSDVVLIGTVDANQVIVSSKVAGRIEHLLVDEGQNVKQGELIAQIDNQDLAAERDSARATLAGLRSQVRQSGETYASTHGETDAQVKNAAAALLAAKASLEESEAVEHQQALDTKRIVTLAEQGVASQQDRDRAEQTLAANRARVRANREQVNAAQATVNTMQARINQAAAAHSNIAATQGQMDSANAKLVEAEVRMEYTRVAAPVNGTVSVRAAREGEVVSVGTPIVTIVDLTQTWVYAAVPETQAQAVKLGDTLDVRMPGGERVPGKIIAKAAEADFATERDYSRTKRDIRTVRLKLLIDNPRETYVPGMTAEVLLPQRLLKDK